MKAPSSALVALVTLAHGAACAEFYKDKYGVAVDTWFSGIVTFAHLPARACLNEPNQTFDIAILGAPYDSSVSFRTGARFGPKGIRDGSRRQRPERAYSVANGLNPYQAGFKVIDCGDVPMSPYDPAMALDQLTLAYATLLSRPIDSSAHVHASTLSKLAKDGALHPRIVTLGGDHTIVDTEPEQYKISGASTDQSILTHGTFFAHAAREGLLGPSIHLGIRTRLTDLGDYDYDAKKVHFQVISADDIDDIGPLGIAKAARERIGDRPCYISLDVDVADPGFAPGTGTLETGGWTPRELRRILRNLHGLNIVGVDVVEVAPAYDSAAEITSYLAADCIHDFLSIMTKPFKKTPASHSEL